MEAERSGKTNCEEERERERRRNGLFERFVVLFACSPVRAAGYYHGAKAVRADVLNCAQTNHFGTIDARKYSCAMTRPACWVIRFM